MGSEFTDFMSRAVIISCGFFFFFFLWELEGKKGGRALFALCDCIV